MLERLRLEIRKKQLYLGQDITKPVTVQVAATGGAEYVPGAIPDNEWQDFTDYTEGLGALKLSWKASAETDGPVNESGSNYSKGVTADLRFTGPAFSFIYNWLMLEPFFLPPQ